jgi:hypothetical protein
MSLKDVADPGSACNPLRPARGVSRPSPAVQSSRSAGPLERFATLEAGGVPLMTARHG